MTDEEISGLIFELQYGERHIVDLDDVTEALVHLQRERDKFRKLDSEAATHVESVIVMRSRWFTGEPPYVGWKGLGAALSQDYDELDSLLKWKNLHSSKGGQTE